jgi:hypothetical protein
MLCSGRKKPETQITKIIPGICKNHHSTIGGDQSESWIHNALASSANMQMHRTRRVDNPEMAGLIGKTSSSVETAIAVDVAEG